MDNIETQLQEALVEISQLKKEKEHLRQENSQLKQQILTITKQNNYREFTDDKSYSRQKELKTRVQLFKSLFKGREDIFAYRWERKNGGVGFSPARKSDGIGFYPLTDAVIYDHLLGRRVIGLYPLLLDNTCWFLAVDFDGENWQGDVEVFMSICKRLDVPANLERSRSGNGCHVWIFFRERTQAQLVRRFGEVLLSHSLKEKRKGRLTSYDRMFPNQDFLTKGKFGNLIALPLQGGPRKNGNTVFVDESFNAYSDQWLYLSKVQKMDKKDIESILHTPTKIPQQFFVNEEIPENLNDFEKIEVIYRNGILITKKNVPNHFIQEIAQLARFSNPAYYQAQKRRLSTNRIPRFIDCSDDRDDYLYLPRGCEDDLVSLFEKKSVKYSLKDLSFRGKNIYVKFIGQLSLQQEEALQSLLAHKTGILAATTGFGKTVVAASLIAKRKVNTLVVVHRKQLLDQWKERLSVFLKIEPNLIGQVGGGKNNPKGIIDIATIQSLKYKGTKNNTINNYGQVIVDECHHFSAFTFEEVLKGIDAAYVHGLTATPNRKDGLEPIMRMQIGPIRYRVSAKEQAKIRPFKHVLIPRFTSFKSKQVEKEIQSIYTEIVSDEKRNDMIFNDVLLELELGSTPIVITERIDHVTKLEDRFSGFTKNLIVLTGELSKKEATKRLKKLDDLSDDEERLVIATGKYIGEGFDHARLDTLFLTMPISWKGTLQQYVGRLHRLHENKTIVKVYDYVDQNEPILVRMYENREVGYKTLGYIVKGSRPDKKITEQMKLF